MTQLQKNHGLENFTLCLWIEVEPGKYKNQDTDQILTRSEIEALNIYNEVNFLVKGFHDDSTPLPDLAVSE